EESEWRWQMILLKWRVFNMPLVLAIAATMPNVIKAQTQMNEIPLGGSSASSGSVQSGSGVAATTTLDGGADPGAANAATAGPEAITFDGTYVWVATQFNNSLTRIRVS